MRSEIFYFISARQDRNLINLCSSNSADGGGSKQKIYIMPDRQMSFLKILDLPPAPENKLRDMVRFQMVKIYPGNTEDISFDFIPFKTETGWRIVLYILKKKYLNEVLDNKRFGGIVLPLKLLPMKVLQSLSTLIFYYSDMVEIWTLTGGVPDSVERHDPRGFSVKDSEKLMTIYPYNETPKWEMKNGRTLEFSETLDSLLKGAIYFPEYRVTKRDRITTPIVITAFIISLFLLSLTALKYTEFTGKERETNTWIESIRLEAEQNRIALEVISKLEDELTQVRGNIPVNVYNLLLRTRKAIDSNTVVLSFGFKSKELSLTLNSRSALDDLEGIAHEFGNVRASNIRTLDDSLENYTVWVEIGQ